MGSVIYSVSPIQAFQSQIITTIVLFLIGIFSLVLSFIRGRGSFLARIALILAGGFLVLASGVLAFLTVREMNGEANTVAVLVEDKQVVQSNCGDGDTCTSYLVETSAAQKYYDFTVARGAFDQIQVRACYLVTYYPQRGLLGQGYNNESYEAASNITRIMVAGSSRCVQ